MLGCKPPDVINPPGYDPRWLYIDAATIQEEYDRLKQQIIDPVEREQFEQNAPTVQNWMQKWRPDISGDLAGAIGHHYIEHRGDFNPMRYPVTLMEYLRKANAAFENVLQHIAGWKFEKKVDDRQYPGETVSKWKGPNEQFIEVTNPQQQPAVTQPQQPAQQIVTYGQNRPTQNKLGTPGGRGRITPTQF